MASGPGRNGRPATFTATRPPCATSSRAPTRRSPTSRSSSSCFSNSGRVSASMRTTAASTCSATCRSASRSTAPTPGRTRRSCASTATAARTPSPACRPITSQKTASSGATRSTTGMRTRKTVIAGGWSGSGPRRALPTWSASIISAASRPTGRCRPIRPRRGRAPGSPGPAIPYSTPCASRSATCRSWPKTSASSRRKSKRCASGTASRAWSCCSSTSPTRTSTCSACRPTASVTRARTTTTPRWAGSGAAPATSAPPPR